MGKINFNSFVNDYMWPTFAILIFCTVLVQLYRNMDGLVDKNGLGTRKEALMDMAWVVGGVVVVLAIIGIVASLLQGGKPNISF